MVDILAGGVPLYPAVFWSQRLAGLLYVLVTIIWLVPDQRIEPIKADIVLQRLFVGPLKNIY